MTIGIAPLVVGIDCGSQSAKVVIVEADGSVIAHGQRVLRAMLRPEHGVVVHPDDDLWDAIVEATRAAVSMLESSGRRASEIAAVGLCSIRCCKAFTDADGELVEPVISWMDDRAYQPYVPLLPDGGPDPRAAWATTTSGHLMRRLTDVAVDTAANCIEMQWPIAADGVDWSADDAVVDGYGLTRSLLGQLVQPGDTGGRTTAAAAALTGLPAGIPVVHTANDKAVEALGSGAVSDRTVVLSLGTYICAMTLGQRQVSGAAPSSYWVNPACIPGRWLYESGGVRRGMWTVTWLLDLLGPEFADRAAADGISREHLIEREAAATPAGSDGLLTVLDWLAPNDRPFRKGSMLGFDARHTRGHLFRSVLEAIALTMRGHVVDMLAELGRALDAGVNADVDLVVTGGGASGDLFMQIIADVFGVDAHRLDLPPGASPAALGAAACAAAAIGLHPSIEAAALAMAPSRHRIAPRPGPHALYGRIADDVHPLLREATDPIYRRTYPLFHETDREDPS